MKILIVEDDEQIAAQVSDMLDANGHQTCHAVDGAKGHELATSEDFDVLVVDRMLPKLDGLNMLATLRNEGNTTPVLILSALGQVDDRVEGLRAGGDDYLAKPFAASELLARIEVLARRNTADRDTVLKVDDLELDRINHSAVRAGERIQLQPREYRLLEYLMRNAGKLVTRTMLLQHVWDLNFDPQTNVIDVHVSRLRAKIDRDFSRPLLHTVRGKGYRFEALDA